MAMRISGLMSGMDTETIVSQLVEARKTKVNKAIKAQKSLKYKQDAWKELNTKIKKLYTNTLSNLRFEGSFVKKTTKVSNSNVVSVITGESAMNSVQSLKVNELAKTAYLTGGKINQEVTGNSKLSELGMNGGSIKIKMGTEAGGIEEVTVSIGQNDTMGDIVGKLRDAGLNANFDEKNQRFYISAKASGEKNDFSIEDAAGGTLLEDLGLGSTAKKQDGQDAEIVLNGEVYTSDKNTFGINGLTLTVNAKTDPNEEVTITTQDDTDGIYDMIKNFFKEYNSLINEMDKLYGAESAKEYEPLLDEEKDAMSDSEIEEWESKIKDSILRKDSTLNTFASEMKRIMMEGVEVDGKKMYLSDFGINTLSYFIAPENEKNAYHIDGDPDDGETSGNADILKSMIANDPDTVVAFFTQLSKNLYNKMSEMMGPNEYSSAMTAYDDKKMKEEYDDYTSKIKDLEKKLADYEDKWYAKFAAMETALAKMQQNASAVTALLGGGA